MKFKGIKEKVGFAVKLQFGANIFSLGGKDIIGYRNYSSIAMNTLNSCRVFNIISSCQHLFQMFLLPKRVAI